LHGCKGERKLCRTWQSGGTGGTARVRSSSLIGLLFPFLANYETMISKCMYSQ
jgi:hypothetical protein